MPEFLKSLTFVPDTYEALRVLAKFVKPLIFVSDFFVTSVLFSVIYNLLVYVCSLDFLLASGDALCPQ